MCDGEIGCFYSSANRRERLFMHEAEGRYWKTRRFTHFEFGDAMVYWTRQLADVSTVA